MLGSSSNQDTCIVSPPLLLRELKRKICAAYGKICVTVCYSVLQCVECVQCVAVCYSVLRCEKRVYDLTSVWSVM